MLGDSKKKLGVVTPPAVNPDVDPDAHGDVHSPGPRWRTGMSRTTIQDLPRIRKPVEWGGAETAPSFGVWMIHEGDLAPDLVAWIDSDKHITIGPARKCRWRPIVQAWQRHDRNGLL